jgi:hypothetical protein
MESFEKNGIWFLPESPDRQITGTLVFSPDQQPRLNLVGELRELDIQEKLESDIEYPLIHGYLIGNSGTSEEVTLCNSYQKKEFKTGVPTSELYPEYILKGYHFSSLDEIEFQYIIVQYDYLEKWVNLPNIEIGCIPHHDQANTYKEIIFNQKVNEPIEIGKINDCSITIIDLPFLNPQFVQLTNLFATLGQNWDRSEILIKEQKKILIKPDSPKNLKFFLDIVDLIQDFLTFGCGQIILPLKIETSIIANNQESETQLFNGVPMEIQTERQTAFPINIFYKVTSPLSNKVSFNASLILFKFTDIRESSATVLNNWQNIREKISSIIEIYLGLYYIPVRYKNDLFLDLAQAIEGFHRIYCEGNYCDEDTFKKIKKKLNETFSSELKKYDIDQAYYESLLRKTEYWNEYSLKERLEDFLDDGSIFWKIYFLKLTLESMSCTLLRYASLLHYASLLRYAYSHLIYYSENNFSSCLPDNFFISNKDKENFIKQVRDTRGFLTHPSSDSKSKKKSKHIVSGNELENLIRKLKIILEICLLKSLGLDSSKIKALTRSRHLL